MKLQFQLVRRTPCLIFACAMLFLCHESFGQGRLVSDDKEHFLGVAEAHRANLEGWRQGDVLLRVNVDGDGRWFQEGVVEGPDSLSLLTRSRRVYRLIFDFTSGRYLIARRGAGSVEAFNSLDEPVVVDGVYPTKQQSIRLILVDPVNHLAIQKLQAGNVTRIAAKTDFEFQAGLAGVPMIPGLGVVSSGTWNLSIFLREYERLTNPDQVAAVTHVGANRFRAIYNFEKRRLSIQTDWDLINFVPLQQRSFAVRESGELDPRPIAERSVAWKELNHAMVPIRFREYSEDVVNYDAKTFLREVTTEIDLHWFSLNEELDETAFDPANLTDPSRLETLLDESIFDDPNGRSTEPKRSGER